MKHSNNKFAAVYVRVSTYRQSTRSQVPDLKRYVKLHRDELGQIRVFTEKGTGKTMDRRKWSRIYKYILNNQVTHLIVWRLDRLGRTVSGLTKLFDELQAHYCNLISLKDNLDLNTATGRMLANILASFAVFDNETRTERILAGQAAAKAAGKRIGGSKKGTLLKITPQQVRAIVRLKADGAGATEISRTVNTSIPNVYRILERVRDGDIIPDEL